MVYSPEQARVGDEQHGDSIFTSPPQDRYPAVGSMDGDRSGINSDDTQPVLHAAIRRDHRRVVPVPLVRLCIMPSLRWHV